ncbi:hypothetical protein BHM03_00003673 [Ensete ventricosum]|uniref:Uncharacterized protein n=1 Tax=Ensete ventricosum TaxID=4639 RepID=A0A445MA62_ENSVE|nr:hypothetical protein BHM03_00003673 [Ensete ventricosum]
MDGSDVLLVLLSFREYNQVEEEGDYNERLSSTVVVEQPANSQMLLGFGPSSAGWRGFRRSGTSLRHGIGKMVLLKTAQHFRMTAHRCARLSIMEEEAIGLDVDALLYGQAARSCARSRATSSPSLSLFFLSPRSPFGILEGTNKHGFR